MLCQVRPDIRGQNEGHQVLRPRCLHVGEGAREKAAVPGKEGVMKRGTPVKIRFPDGEICRGYYDKPGHTVWHRIASGEKDGNPSSAGWWAVGFDSDLAPWFEEVSP